MLTLGISAATLVLAASMVRALVAQARIAPPFCQRCGEQLERRRLGEPICTCKR